MKRHGSFGAMQAGGGGARAVIRGADSGWEGLFYDCVPQTPPPPIYEAQISLSIYIPNRSLLTYTSQPHVKEEAVTMATVCGNVTCSMKGRESEHQ